MPRGVRAQGQGEPPLPREAPVLLRPREGQSCGRRRPLPRRVEGRLFPPRILSLAVKADKDFKTPRKLLEDMCQETSEKTKRKGRDSGQN